MKVLLCAAGAAGAKAMMSAIASNAINIEDTVMINSTSKDFPKDYTGKTIILADNDTGCGKERAVAKEYAKKAISEGKLTFDNINKYEAVVVVTSCEGGTGSGSAPIIAKFFNKVCNRNAHIIALTGFENDIRGISNTVEFFKEIDPAIMVQTISNKAFLSEAGNNNLKAEELANKEFAERLSVLTGKDFIEGSQNIDDTDILKLSNTSGYMTVEKKYFNKSLETRDDFEKIIKNMYYKSASIKANNAARIGAILNIKPESSDAIDYSFETLKEVYGNPFEFFTQVQWDGKKEYIAYIVSGMKMPIDEVEAIYERYIEESSKLDKTSDEFFSKIKDMNILDEDSKFNMIKNPSKGISCAEFLEDN